MTNATMARCTSAARQTGYGIRGCAGIDIMRPDKALAIYWLTRGAVVVMIDGERCERHWRPTQAEADTLFWTMRAAMIKEEGD